MLRYLIILALTFAGPLVAQTRVIDGDTFELNGKIIRINGIDAPEHGQKCGDWNCGKAATDALSGLISGKSVSCDSLGEDGYGRTIATCFVDKVDVGEALVDQGNAWAFLEYSKAYEVTQQNAKARRNGIWAGDFQTPWAFRAAKWSSADEGPNGCRIKGNISDNGMIYHTPWSPWYKRTRINLKRGERWFCDEAEALAAGWRAPFWN